MTELKQKIEAILFSAGKEVKLQELSQLCRASGDEIKKAISEIKQQYESSPSIMVVEEGDAWKLAVRESHLSLVRKVVRQTELSKTLIETLAVVAWKAPVLQSEVIKIRTKKAYEHIKLLEEKSFITRKKHGRTQLIALAQKFYDYFDLKGQEQVKQKFSRFDEEKIASQINEAVNEAEKLKKIIGEDPK